MTTLDWRLQVVEPDQPISDQPRLRTLLSLGPAARQTIAGLERGTKLVLGIEVEADGTIGGVTVPGAVR
jgi:hypothetical protein